jgi:hypothetical protein
MAASSQPTPKHVVSVSLGSGLRDSLLETEILGTPVLIERRGTNGSIEKAIELVKELDGRVDAFGLGGTDLYIQAANKKYYLRDSLRIAKHAVKTPMVCGAGLKDTLERTVVQKLDSVIKWKGKKVLMVSAVDRFGMAESLSQLGADVLYADLIYILGLKLPLKSLKSLARVANIIAPIATQLPISWLYPTGSKQEKSETGWRTQYFDWAEIIAGDFHFIKRYAPENLQGKIILTNTTTKDDVEMLRKRGVKTLITTTPRVNGRSFSTNWLEAAFVAVSGTYPLSPDDYKKLLEQSKLEPDVLKLNL